MGDWQSFLFISAVLLAATGLLIAPTTAAQDGESGVSIGEPDLDAFVPEPEVTPGTEDTIDIQLNNRGNLRSNPSNRNAVTDARGVTVEITDEGPFDVKTGTTSIGSLSDGQTATVAQNIAVPTDLEPGEYDITVEIEYAYSSRIFPNAGVSYDRTGTETVDLTIEVTESARFAVGDIETDVQPGGDGPATIEIENIGSETANQAQATITGGGGVTVDGDTAQELLGDLAPGDNRTISVDIDVAETTSLGSKPLEVAISYRNAAGIQREATPETGGLSPGAQQEFSITDIQDTLSVGYDGEVTANLTNDGPRSVDDAVVIVEPMSDSLFVEDTRYALPELESGEATTIRYPMDVSGQADPGPRQLRFTVEYTSGDRSTVEHRPISQRVVVDGRSNEFALESVTATVRQGETADFILNITNQRSETLSNIDAQLYTSAPLTSNNDEAFVPSLAPGESAEIRFDVIAADTASPEFHPVELDFQYDTERGETVVSDTYQHPISVEPGVEDDGGILGILIAGVLVIVLLGGGIVLWRRRRATVDG